MANQFINAMSDLWNSSGTTYSSIKMNVTNAASAAASKLLLLQIGSVDKFSVDKIGNVVAVGSITGAGVTSSGASLPSANDAAALGASGTAWSDLFLASGGVINWNQNDIAITHAADALAFTGAASGYSFDALISPALNDSAALGTATVSWSDLFLAIGAEVNYGNGNAKIVHSAGVLTVAPGDLRVTTAGTASASVVTVGGSQTLTGKILTSPTINTAAIVSPTISGAPTAGGATWTSLGTVTTVAIAGGTINGAVIGGVTPAAITGTSVTGSSASFSTIAATTSLTSPVGTFSTSVFGGRSQASQIFESTGTNVILAPAVGLNTIIFRPRGASDSVGQVTIDNAGSINAPGNITAGGNIIGDSITATPTLSVKGASGNIHVWWNGPAVEDRAVIYTTAATAGNLNLRVTGTQTFVFNTSGQFSAPGAVFASGAYLNTDGNIVGSIWNNLGYGDAYTAIVNRIESRGSAWADNAVSRVDDTIAAMGASALGSYVFGRATVASIGVGGALAGSQIHWSNAAGDAPGGINVGSWRAMGWVGSGVAESLATLFLRYA